jgi:hypothetical protein
MLLEFITTVNNILIPSTTLILPEVLQSPSKVISSHADGKSTLTNIMIFNKLIICSHYSFIFSFTKLLNLPNLLNLLNFSVRKPAIRQ